MAINNHRFATDVLRLASGTAIAQAISILATPIVTRLYGPEAFGVLALFIAITTVITTVSCLRYELAIPLSTSDEEGASLLALSIASVALITAISAPLLFILGGPLLALLRAPALASYIWLMPITILFGGAYLALNYWMTRRQRFGTLAGARVTKSTVNIGSQLAGGYAGYRGGMSLITANIMGITAATVLLAIRAWRQSGSLMRSGMKWQLILAAARRYRKFPIYSTWSALLNNLSWQLPALLLSYFYSTEVAGYYALSASLLGIPMNLIGNSVAQVFYQSAAAATSAEELRHVVESAFRQIVRLAMLPLLLIGLVGRDLFQIAFGSQWTEAGVYSQILSAWIFFWFISSPLSTLLSVMEEQEFDLKMNVVLVTSRFAALSIGGYLGSARLSITLFSVFGVLVYGSLSLVYLRMARVSLAYAGWTVLRQFMIFVPVGVVLIGMDLVGANAWARLGVAALSFVGYAWYVVWKHPISRGIRARLGFV
jgi:lipopolysaccharide exporter